MKRKTITCNYGILTYLIKQLVTTYKQKKNMSSNKEEKYEVAEFIRYIRFSGDDEKFYERKEKPR